MTYSNLPRERWPEYSRLLDEALDLPEPARADWLAAQERRDAAQGAWLRRVLGHADTATAPAYLERPRVDQAPDNDVAPGVQIGPYRLVRELGTGGMGVVWLARRADGQLDRDVALKLPHVHLLAGAVRERFARERNILAHLNHPHIATLYDAGLAANGRPYLALEFVDGRPITQWCRERAATIDERLGLMRQVMEAVVYAHARLVVHRDLKPSNMLVTADGTVKLLDFGIAKMLAADESADESGALTRLGQRMATPGYSAPEQLAGGAVTTRADVYALGVMLYGLLCGQRPFVLDDAQVRAPLAEAPLCSTRVTPDFAATVGESSAATLRNALRGDLDAIVAKAIDPMPERRYGSVEALAADLERRRRHEPILAQRIGRVAMAAKFVRRHRLGTASSTALVVAIGVGVALVAWQANEAAQQARRAEAAKAFLVEIFSASDPRIASDHPRGEIRARELLDLGATRIEREFAGDPRTQIDLLATVSAIYRELGATDRALALDARKVELAQRYYGELSPPVLESAVQSAGFACVDQAENCAALQRVADGLLNRARYNDSTLRADWWVTEGIRMRALTAMNAERRAAFEKAVAIYRDVAPRHTGYVTAIEELASNFQMHGDFARSIELHEDALRVAKGLPQRNDAELQTIYGNLALVYQQNGELIKASETFDMAANIAERTSGFDFATSRYNRAESARTRHLAGDRDAADATFEALLLQVSPSERHAVGASITREYFGERLAAEGRAARAVPLLEGVERDYVERVHDEFDLRRVRLRLGDALDRAGRADVARKTLSMSLADYIANESPDEQALLAARERWGRFLLDHGEATEASEQFDEVVRQAHERRLSHIALAHADLARVALLRKNLDGALAESASALDLWEHREGFYDVRMGPYLQRIRADVLAATGRQDEAQHLEDDAFTASEKFDAPESPTRRHRTLARPP
ncbi:MAG: serine/threonine-protein kinase [Casimicrobiaceae bacterium]